MPPRHHQLHALRAQVVATAVSHPGIISDKGDDEIQQTGSEKEREIRITDNERGGGASGQRQRSVTALRR